VSELPVTDNFELQILTPLPKLTTSYLGLKLVFEELEFRTLSVITIMTRASLL
jgi:hypothetical protein